MMHRRRSDLLPTMGPALDVAYKHWPYFASTGMLPSEIVQYGTYANKPAAGSTGGQYIATDNPFNYMYTGAAWVARMPGSVLNHNPGLSSFQTWVNQDSAAIDTTTGIVKLTPLAGQANTTERFHLRVDPVVGAQFTMTLAFQFSRTPGAVSYAGLVLRDSSSGKFMVYMVSIVSAEPRLVLAQYTNPTTLSSGSAFSDLWRIANDRDVYLRLVADATKFYFYYSFDGGGTWQLHRTRTIAGDFMATYDQVGYGINNYSQVASTQEVAMNVLHAVQTTP